jgi:hypothetical protein
MAGCWMLRLAGGQGRVGQVVTFESKGGAGS